MLYVTEAAMVAYEIARGFAERYSTANTNTQPAWSELPHDVRIELVTDMGRMLEMDRPWCGDTVGDAMFAMVAQALKPFVGRLTVQTVH